MWVKAAGRRLSFLLPQLLGLASAGAQAANTPETFEALTQRLGRATVMVCTCELVPSPPRGFPCGKIVAKGSGFFINPEGLLLTARHVIPGTLAPHQRILILQKSADGSLWSATSGKVQALYPEIDAATVQFVIKDRKIDWLPISPSSANQGEEVAVFGYPADAVSLSPSGEVNAEQISSRVAKTIVSSVERRSLVFVPGVNLVAKELVEAQFTFAKGNSGGPLVSVRTGKVVGLVTGSMNIPQGVVPISGDSKNPLQGVPFATYSYAVSMSEIRAKFMPALTSVMVRPGESAKL